MHSCVHVQNSVMASYAESELIGDKLFLMTRAIMTSVALSGQYGHGEALLLSATTKEIFTLNDFQL